MKLDELEKLAKAATPGPWKVKFDINVSDREGVSVLGAGGTDATAHFDRNRNNATFIAAANPATVLRLVELLRESQAAINDLLCWWHGRLPPEYMALLAKLEGDL